MKYRYLILGFLVYSCAVNSTKLENRSPYNSKGFAYIYNDEDYRKNTIKTKMDDSKYQISVADVRTNSLIKIINPKTNDSITVLNSKKINYPDFYKVLITKSLADKLNLNYNLPLVEVIEIKKNKSFIAKKAEIFNEEKKISTNAPVESVKISNISKNNKNNQIAKTEDFFILIGSFSSENVIDFLKDRFTKEIPDYNIKKLIVSKKSNKNFNLLSGPYNAINFMKNDYILLKRFGFEQLDIITNE